MANGQIFSEPRSGIVGSPDTPTSALPGTGKIAGAREDALNLINSQGATGREMQYQNLQLRKQRNEISGPEYLRQLEMIAGSVNDETEKAKWQAELQKEKSNVLRESQSIEEKRIELALKTGNMNVQQATAAYKALATQSMAAGDVEGALSYELAAANAINAYTIRSRGSGSGSKSKGTGTKGDAKLMGQKLESAFKQNANGFSRDISDIKIALNNGELTKEQADQAMMQALGQFKAATFEVTAGPTFGNYMNSKATENQKFSMLEKGIQAASMLRGRGGEIDIAKVLSDQLGILGGTQITPEDIIQMMGAEGARAQGLSNITASDAAGNLSETEEATGGQQEFASALFESAGGFRPPQAQTEEPSPVEGEGQQQTSSGLISRALGRLGGGQGAGGFAKKVFGLFGN